MSDELDVPATPPPEAPPPPAPAATPAVLPEGMKACPACAKPMISKARKCPSCGHSLAGAKPRAQVDPLADTVAPPPAQREGAQAAMQLTPSPAATVGKDGKVIPPPRPPMGIDRARRLFPLAERALNMTSSLAIAMYYEDSALPAELQLELIGIAKLTDEDKEFLKEPICERMAKIALPEWVELFLFFGIIYSEKALAISAAVDAGMMRSWMKMGGGEEDPEFRLFRARGYRGRLPYDGDQNRIPQRKS